MRPRRPRIWSLLGLIDHRAKVFLGSRSLTGVLMAGAVGAAGNEPGSLWEAPSAAALSPSGDRLYVACSQSRHLLAFESVAGALLYSRQLEVEPTGVATCVGSPQLWMTCAGGKNSVVVVDGRTGLAQANWPAGHGVCSPVIAPNSGRLYVCNRFDGEVQAFERDTGRELGRVHASDANPWRRH